MSQETIRKLAETLLDNSCCGPWESNSDALARMQKTLAPFGTLLERVGTLERALQVIELAIRDDRGETYWPARKFLDDRGIFNGDLNDLRVVHAVAKSALEAK